MSNYASAVIATAKAEVGYYGKKSAKDLYDKTANITGKYTKYAYEFDTKYTNFYNGKKNGYDWCDVFVDWCMVHTFGEDVARNLLCQPTKSCGAGTDWSAKYYKEHNQFFTSPQPGDQIFFGTESNNMYHTGLVYAVDKDYVYTVEGNISSHVGTKKYALSTSKIRGYGRPKYDKEPVKPVTTPTIMVTNAVLALRSEASSTKGSRYCYMPKYSAVTVIEKNVAEADGYEWNKVKYGSQTGYCANKYLSATKTKTTTAALALRSQPGVGKGVRYCYIPANTKVTILCANYSKVGDYTWDKVYYNKEGYSANKYLK